MTSLLLAQVTAWTCVAIFLVSFVIIICCSILVISRTGMLIDRKDERTLGWSARMGRKSSRFNRFFVADEFRSLRRLCFSAVTAATLSFFTLFVLVTLVDEL